VCNELKIYYEGHPNNLKDFTKQDSIILNIQRACETSIDLAMHIVSEKNEDYQKQVERHSNYC